MNQEDFNEVVEDRTRQIIEVLTEKAKEYSSDTDRLHNFKVGAALLGVSPEKYAWFLSVKHLVSIQDTIDAIDEEFPSQEYVNEKFGDAINYLILLDALIRERRSGD